jgi:hypothetical protein
VLTLAPSHRRTSQHLAATTLELGAARFWCVQSLLTIAGFKSLRISGRLVGALGSNTIVCLLFLTKQFGL